MDSHADADKLSIRCPGCGQRFKVGLELRDRMVECGTCEHRFRVNDEVVVRTKKFYPGERRTTSLDAFARVPKTTAAPKANFQTIQYSPEPVHHHPVESGSPLRLILGFSAVAIAVLISLLLIFGGSPGGMLYGTSQSKRLMLAAFCAVVGGALLLAANPRARRKAVAGSLAMAAGLLALPFVFTEGTTTAGPVVTDDRPLVPRAEDLPQRVDDLEALKQKLVYSPVERALESDPHAIGLWLKGLQEYHKLQVRDYIIRASGADPGSHMYRRSDDYLMVVTGVTEDLSEMARLCERFGEVKRTIDPLRVIEVEVNNASFQEGPLDKLGDSANPAFYELNRRELESIDLERARRAISRLAPVEPKLYRKDIARRMADLLREADPAMQEDIGKALPTWSEPGDGSEDAARLALEKAVEYGDAPESLVAFLVLRQDAGSIPLIEQLWALDPNKWESHFGGMGAAIEPALLKRFPETTVTQRMSAVRLFGKVGTAAAVPVLEAQFEGANPELRLLLERSLEGIRSRQ
jgi:hypothetical protein